jgi:hypothetical protein
LFFYCPFFFGIHTQQIVAQDSVNVQVKVYDIELNTLPEVRMEVENSIEFTTNSSGLAFIKLASDMLPPKHIESLSNAFEVEAWNYSKGILEVTLRQRVTKYIMVRLIDQKENVLVGITTRIPKYDIAEVSNSNGELLIGIPVMASLLVSDFNIQGYDVLKLTGRGNEIEVTAR